ncbi:Detected protein of unknown function [Hibiscus syriacus]|uniref:RRM domain-containing protein n=1 Tax=Hibiscus syriacus TaxID=106335 RepID=A0A6A3A6J2_HIBSY|nr:Detected protein of unknown function [Hibiscus syriacus]
MLTELILVCNFVLQSEPSSPCMCEDRARQSGNLNGNFVLQSEPSSPCMCDDRAWQSGNLKGNFVLQSEPSSPCMCEDRARQSGNLKGNFVLQSEPSSPCMCEDRARQSGNLKGNFVLQSEPSSPCMCEDRARQSGNLKGRVIRGSSSHKFWQAKPKANPNAVATGTATAFPTCMYLLDRIPAILVNMANEKRALWERFKLHGKVVKVFIPIVNKRPKYRDSTFTFVHFESQEDLLQAVAKRSMTGIHKQSYDVELIQKALHNDGITAKVASFLGRECTSGVLRSVVNWSTSELLELSFFLQSSFKVGELVEIKKETLQKLDCRATQMVVKAASPFDFPESISINTNGHSHLLPQADYTRSRGYVSCYPVDSMVLPGQSHPMRSPLSHGESSEPQQQQTKTSRCQPQSSQLQDNVDIEHSHMSLTDSTVRGIRCALKYSAGPNKSNRVNQEQCQIPARADPTEPGTAKVHKKEERKRSYSLPLLGRQGRRAPLTFIHRRAVPDSYKVDMWEYTKFDIDPSGKSWVMQAIGTKWRDWKADLKATYYDSLKTDEERLKVHDPRVVPEQWPSLISYWNTDETKPNKRPDGKEPTRAELYILTHTRKYGQPVDETAAKLISKIREQEAKKQNNSQRSDESNDTLCQVMGEEKDDCVETSGMGPNRTGIFGSRPSRAALVRMASEAKSSANKEVRKMAVKMEAMEEKYTLMENHMARMASNMEKFLQKIGVSSNILGSELATSYTSI